LDSLDAASADGTETKILLSGQKVSTAVSAIFYFGEYSPSTGNQTATSLSGKAASQSNSDRASPLNGEMIR
jgi:hypothetical protein